MPRSSLNSNDIALDCLLFANELLLSTHRAPSLSICQVGDQKVNASMSKNISKSSLNNVSKKGKFQKVNPRRSQKMCVWHQPDKQRQELSASPILQLQDVEQDIETHKLAGNSRDPREQLLKSHKEEVQDDLWQQNGPALFPLRVIDIQTNGSAFRNQRIPVEGYDQQLDLLQTNSHKLEIKSPQSSVQVEVGVVVNKVVFSEKESQNEHSGKSSGEHSQAGLSKMSEKGQENAKHLKSKPVSLRRKIFEDVPKEVQKEQDIKKRSRDENTLEAKDYKKLISVLDNKYLHTLLKQELLNKS